MGIEERVAWPCGLEGSRQTLVLDQSAGFKLHYKSPKEGPRVRLGSAWQSAGPKLHHKSKKIGLEERPARSSG